MNIIVFGGTGKIGKAVAWDLSKEDSIEKIGLVGRRRQVLEETARMLPEGKTEIHAIDILDKEDISRVIKNYDVGVIAMPDRRTSYRVAETAIYDIHGG